MEDDVDIYSDLPSFNLNLEKNVQVCNCKELKKELSLLISKLGNIQRIKTNLENNLFSLLKTARAEITRKDKMIDDLRKRLDDITFRRSHNSRSLGFSTHRLSHQHTVTRKYENVPLIHSQETEIESYQIQFYSHDEYKNKKSQNDVNRIPTVFGERLHKRIIEDEKEEKKQKALLKLSAETKNISKEENIIENDKENGFQFSINNKDNESIIGRCSSLEPPCRKNLVKRTNEEDDTHRHKRIKIENNENKTMTETDYNYLTQCDLTENPTQYEMKDNLIKFEDRLDAAHSFKKEEISFCTERRAASEYRDMKQDQDYTNGWKSETRKNNSAKDRDSSSTKNSLADSLRNSRTASTSHRERFSDYKKNEYRYSPPRRSYSRSRSDYESSNHRLRERSNRTYREKKYDDYKYDNRHKNDKLKKNYEKEENDRKTRYRRKERGDQRDKSRYSSSDADDKESNSSYKNKKYENRKIKKETTIVSNDKKMHENNKAATETNLRESSSRTIVNNIMNYSTGKNIEQVKVKNESEIKSINLTGSTSVHVAKKDLDILEEGEILDSSENKNNFAKIFEDNKMEENNVKIVLVEDKNGDISVNKNASIDDKSIPLQNDTNSTKQLEMANISVKKIEVASYLQENSKNYEEIIQLNSSKSNMAIDEAHNCIKDEDKCKFHINEMEDLMDSTTQNIGIIKQIRDSNINNNNKNDEKKSKDSVAEIAIKIKEMIDSNIENVIKIKELDESSIESVTKKEKINNPDIESVVEIEVSNFNNDNNIHEIDAESRTSIAEVVTKVEAVLNCNIEDRDKSQAPIENETFHQMSNKNDVKMYLNDHNYVQNSINISDLDANQKSSLRSKCETVSETVKETKAEKAINVQSVDVKRTMSSTVKNKKVQQSKGILISHRRKAVILSDSNASMTVLMNTNIEKTSSVINNCNDSTLKPRACKISRVTIKATCK